MNMAACLCVCLLLGFRHPEVNNLFSYESREGLHSPPLTHGGGLSFASPCLSNPRTNHHRHHPTLVVIFFLALCETRQSNRHANKHSLTNTHSQALTRKHSLTNTHTLTHTHTHTRSHTGHGGSFSNVFANAHAHSLTHPPTYSRRVRRVLFRGRPPRD